MRWSTPTAAYAAIASACDVSRDRAHRADEEQRVGVATVPCRAVAHLGPVLGERRGRHRRGDPAVPDARGALERDVGVATHEDRDRPLHRAGFGIHRRDVVELAVELDEVALGAPQRAQHLDVLLGATAAPVPRHVHRLGFLTQPSDADPVQHATARVHVEGGQLARVRDRVADGEHRDRGAELGAARETRRPT